MAGARPARRVRWQVLIYALVVTHITIAAVTIYLHRSQAHRALELHPLISHFFRFWLWLTTGMVTKEWVAIHRKHHAKCETVDDPHSPVTRGIKTVLLTGSELYRAEAKVQDTLDKYGHNTPDDWIERNLYTPYSWQGVTLMLIVNLLLFGAIGAAVWALQMAWIPITAAGIINGIGHYWGYRNFEAPTRPPTSRPGASSSAARNCTTTTTPTPRRPSCRSRPMNSTSAGSTSA
jgi:stearoyl-CoA desaturase (delta-9 desaturase)